MINNLTESSIENTSEDDGGDSNRMLQSSRFNFQTNETHTKGTERS